MIIITVNDRPLEEFLENIFNCELCSHHCVDCEKYYEEFYDEYDWSWDEVGYFEDFWVEWDISYLKHKTRR